MPTRPTTRRYNLILGLIAAFFCTLLVAIYFLWQALTNAEQQQAQARLQLESNTLAHGIESRFEQQTGTLNRLAERWSLHHDHHALWQADARRLLRDFSNLQAIEWLDSRHHMQWIEPLAGNEAAAGLIYSTDHPNYPLLLKARDSGQAQLSNSFLLTQGGLGLAYYVPLYDHSVTPERFDGFLLGIFRVEVLLDDLMQDLQADHLSITLLENGDPLFSYTTNDYTTTGWTINSPVQLGQNDSFSLVVYPTHGLLATTTTRLPAMVAIGGNLAVLFLCCSLGLLVLGAWQRGKLTGSNRQLKSEIARRQKIEETLKHNQAHLKLINDMTDHSHDALFIIALNPPEIIHMNRTCWEGLGYSAQTLRQILHISPKDVMPGVGPWLHALEQTTHHQGQAIFQQQVIHSDGHSSPLEISVRHLHRLGRDHLICVGRNNSAQLLLAERLQRLSDHDGLTGLYNRRYFDETLTTEWRRLSREKTPLGLLMIDVDHFKSFNDHLGHQAGDDALKKLATALDDNLMREGDCVCRYGGEEFAVILPGADEKQCLKVARRLHDAIAELNIRHPDSPHPKGLLTISIGAASLMPMPQRNPQDLIKQADDALYRAKHAGRDRTCLAEQE